MPLKKKNIVAAEKANKSKKPLPKGLQSDVMARLQKKGLTHQMAQEIIQSKDDYLAGVMVEALISALEERVSQKAS